MRRVFEFPSVLSVVIIGLYLLPCLEEAFYVESQSHQRARAKKLDLPSGNFTKPVCRFVEWRFPEHWPSLEHRSRRTVLLVLANSLPLYSRQTREVAHVYHSPCRLKIHEPPAACVTVVSNFSSNHEVREYGDRCSRGIFLS